MSKSNLFVLALIGLAVASVTPALAAGGGAEAIKYRQSVMKAIGGHMGAIAAYVKGEVDHAAHVPVHADALREASIEVILDDRDERPGVKFKDADLVGIPYRITVGPKGLAEGKVDFQRRRDGESRQLDVHKAADWATETILEERR